MITVEIPTRLTVDDLVSAVAKLPPLELLRFMNRVLALQSERGLSWLVNQEEQALLALIDQSLPAPQQARLDELRTKSQDAPLTPTEQTELLQFIKQIEQFEIKRVEALVKLAQKRNLTLTELMKTLNIEVKYA